jgi:hypothetical protein
MRPVKHKRQRFIFFIESITKKVFSTKYHEGAKDKKNNNPKNNFNPKNVCCASVNSQ